MCSTIQEIVIKIFEEVSGYKVELSTALNELTLDSLDIVEIVMRIEEEFKIFIPDGDIESLKTVAEVVEYVKESCEN